jgi:hypothetical protein
MHPHPTGRRVLIYNALPSTKVFVAKDGTRVVGTVTLVQDSPIGLPMDQVYREELAALRARARRLGEASTLTVDPDYRDAGVAILMRLFRMLTLYAAKIARLHDYGLVIHPHHARFYRTCFPLRPIGPRKAYPRLNGAPVLGFRLDLGLMRALIRVAQAGLAFGRRHEFFFGPEQSRPVLARLRRDLPRSGLTPDQVGHFFAGHGAETATSLVLAAGLLSAGHRVPNGGRPALPRFQTA